MRNCSFTAIELPRKDCAAERLCLQMLTVPEEVGSICCRPILETHRPLELVVLMLGTNDCKTAYKTTPEKIGVGIERLLDQIWREREDLPVLLISPIHLGADVEKYDREFDRRSVEVSKGLKKVYEQIAKRRGIAFLAASDVALPGEKDQEHMTREGHAALAEAVFEKVREILLEKEDSRLIGHVFCA